jgi:hypothetical protein
LLVVWVQFQAGEGGGMIVDIIRIVRLFFGRKINGKGAMLETMTFWANKDFIAYVAAGGIVRFRANKEFRIQLSWHSQRRSCFLLNEEINVTARFWVIEEFRDFSVVPFFEERSIQWSFARQRHCPFLWQT